MIRRIINWYFLRFPKEMVGYWKSKEAVKAKVTRAKEGHTIMIMEGEKYPFPGFPRGTVLFGTLSKLKHEIKVQIFNESWADLEAGREPQLDSKIDTICQMIHERRFDFLPFDKMCPAVKEIYRALSLVEEKMPSERARLLKEGLCFILQEDDAYRFRVQWMAKFLTWGRWKNIKRALELMEHAEVVGDMKGRIKLLRRVLTHVTEGNERFDAFMKECNWKKVKLSKADKYFFRAKYFKVDFPLFEY